MTERLQNQTPQKIPRASSKTSKNPPEKNPPENHEEFPCPKNFQKAVNHITRKLKLEMECLCLRPGYPGNTNELQIALKTQKGSYLNQGASQVLASCVASEDRALNDKDDGSDNDKEVA